MRIKLDENLSAELVDDLEALGHEVDTVPGEGLTGQPDIVVASAAETENRVLFTLDKDIADIRQFPLERFRGLVVFRVDQKGRLAMRRSVMEAMERLGTESDLRECLIVVSDRGLRRRR